MVRSMGTCIVVLLVAMELGNRMTAASKADVNIFNELGERGSNPMQVHCRSGNTELKEVTLVAGQSFGWGFVPNIWGTTLFHCSFAWGAKQQHFDVWKHHGCKHCLWRVREDGFYRHSLGTEPVFMHPWL